ncbi:hypothetical protein F503_00058 [Ophiostoma piceae UAMH 11346]|uniref:Life-span regulatory factor n=1 Tax=Ophiostoma piceae (strain UAMH 11346) TaxID=1262450 RepID=S3BUH0_OPHP1|nr:hypothetical protein F503_00058 [Ophiostoma piceae UAMH 11346]
MHHTRRKSGHGSMTDVRKAASASDSKYRTSSSKQTTSSGTHSSSRRPGTTQSSSKSSSKYSSSRDQDEDYWYDDERESFPQFCMTCEKQFVAKDDHFLYCSEACRDYDQEHGASISTQHFKDSYISSRIYAHQPQEPRDIIPRASPSRPSSTYYSHPSAGMPSAMSSTMPNTSTSSAIAALRSLSLRDASPPSPTTAPTSAGIWPFSSSSRSTATSPSNSYTQSSAVYATTYDNGYYRTGAPNYYSYGSESAGFAGAGAERPLPPRRPGSYSRPKSIELVTPLLGQ